MKRALVISGGGSAGAYAVGALKALREEFGADQWSTIVGTSTGSLIGTLVAAYCVTGDSKYITDLGYIYTHVSKEDILGKAPSDNPVIALVLTALGGRSSIYSIKPLEELMARFMSDDTWNKICSSKEVELIYCCTSFQTGKAKFFSSRECDVATMKLALMASSSQPVFMPPITIGKEQYFDGGVQIFSPIEIALAKPVNQIVSIYLDVPGPQEKPTDTYKDLGGVFPRTVELLVDRVGDGNLDRASLVNVLSYLSTYYPAVYSSLLDYVVGPEIEVSTPKKILHIYPESKLAISGLDFDPKQMTKLMQRGFQDAFKVAKASKWLKVRV